MQVCWDYYIYQMYKMKDNKITKEIEAHLSWTVSRNSRRISLKKRRAAVTTNKNPLCLSTRLQLLTNYT